jgi:hypothetical protein
MVYWDTMQELAGFSAPSRDQSVTVRAMSRWVLILALVTGVTTAHARGKKKSSSKDRRPTKSTKANMPRGFTWPPSKSMVSAGEECERTLDELGVAYDGAKRVGRVVTPLRLTDGTIGGVTFTPAYSKNQVFDCQLVVALANFTPRLYELGVREVKYGSAFRWSKVRVNGKTKNILSRHALGIALDIVSFVDDTGREANVEKDYKRDDELLLGIERAVNDSGRFRILLTPRNDPRSHDDHFHLEANPDYSDARGDKPAS